MTTSPRIACKQPLIASAKGAPPIPANKGTCSLPALAALFVVHRGFRPRHSHA